MLESVATAPPIPLTHVQRAAVILLSLGEEHAVEVLKYLTPEEVQVLGAAMTAIGLVPHHVVADVLDEFIDALDQPPGVGINAEDYVRAVMVKALGEDRAHGLIDRIEMGRNTAGLDALKWMEPRAVADMIRNEHPQIMAIVLAHLEPDHAAEILKCIAENVRSDVLLRIATLDGIPPHALNELNDVMTRQFSGAQAIKSSSIGGVKLAANILNFMDSGQDETILGTIENIDGKLSAEIRELMFVFDNLADLDDKAIQTILREASGARLDVALRGAEQRVRDRIMSNMSQRAAENLVDDMEARGPVRLAEVEAAQKEILAVVRRLSESGAIQISTKNEAFV